MPRDRRRDAVALDRSGPRRPSAGEPVDDCARAASRSPAQLAGRPAGSGGRARPRSSPSSLEQLARPPRSRAMAPSSVAVERAQPGPASSVGGQPPAVADAANSVVGGSTRARASRRRRRRSRPCGARQRTAARTQGSGRGGLVEQAARPVRPAGEERQHRRRTAEPRERAVRRVVHAARPTLEPGRRASRPAAERASSVAEPSAARPAARPGVREASGSGSSVPALTASANRARCRLVGAVRAATSTRPAPGSVRRAVRAVAGVAQVAQGGQHVVALGVAAGASATSCRGPQPRLGRVDQRGEVARRGRAGRRRARRARPAARCRTRGCLQHPVAQRAPAVGGDLQQRLVDQRERAGRRRRPPAAGRRRRRAPALAASAPAGKTASRSASSRSSVGQQVPAPLDHRPQRPVPGERGPAAAGQQPEPVGQPGGDLGRRGSTRSRAAASSIASGRPSSRRQISTTGGDVVVVEHEAGRDRGGPVERAAARPGSRRASAASTSAGGQRRAAASGAQRLAGDRQRLPAGGQHPQRRARGQQLGRPARPPRRSGARSCRAPAGSRAVARARRAAASSGVAGRRGAPRRSSIAGLPQPERGERRRRRRRPDR